MAFLPSAVMQADTLSIGREGRDPKRTSPRRHGHIHNCIEKLDTAATVVAGTLSESIIGPMGVAILSTTVTFAKRENAAPRTVIGAQPFAEV